jgi:hypothetical protein
METAAHLAPTIDISVDISWTGDLPATYTNRAPRREVAVDLKSIAGVERPAFERYDLDVHKIEARVWKKQKGPPSIGRVTNASITGMWVEVDDPFPMKTDVSVELVVAGGYSATLSGRVVRQVGRGMAIHLSTDDSTWHFRSSFLELSRKAEATPPSVIIRKGEAPPQEGDVVADMRVLGGKWHEVLADLDSDPIHQGFIQECIRRRRLEFALERYRELRGGPDEEVAARYLAQIGKILGFISLKKETKDDDPSRNKTIKLLVLLLLVLGVLFVAQQVYLVSSEDGGEMPQDMILAPPPRDVAPEPPGERKPPAEEKQGLWDLPSK